MTDYRKLRFNNLTSKEFRHLFLLIFWPVYGLAFWFLERGVIFLGIEPEYTPIVTDFDAQIPFCEFFMIPYLLWFAYLVWIHIHTGLTDIPQFKKLMYFIMLSYTVTLIIYIIFPNKQDLRPTEFTRNNFLTDWVKGFYAYDTNTNVCPSLHVIGSFAVLFAAWNSNGLKTVFWRSFNLILTLVISMSTVFLKQHSIIDIYAGLAVCIVSFFIVYVLPYIRVNKALKADEKIKIDKKDEITAEKS